MDASKNFSLGFGGICMKKHWMQARWPKDFKELDPSIQYLELFAQTASILAWTEYFKNKRIIIHCDNQSVVSMINNSSSTCKNCMVLIRILTMHCMIKNIRVFARHVKTSRNKIADSLSRFHEKCFAYLTRKFCDLDSTPTEIPNVMWPPMKIWVSN